MDTIIDILTGEVYANTGKDTLTVNGIGSCGVVVAYDIRTTMSGCAHIMLPGSNPRKTEFPGTQYAREAIDELMLRMVSSGADPSCLEACLVGCANVLQKDDDTLCASIKNSIITILAEKAIPIKASHVGGILRRALTFDPEWGTLSMSVGDNRASLLYRWQ